MNANLLPIMFFENTKINGILISGMNDMNTTGFKFIWITLNGPFIILYVVFSEILLYKFTACKAIVNPYEGPLDSGSLAPASTYASTKPSLREQSL